MSCVTLIDLWTPQIHCIVCGESDVSRWGLAVYEGEIVPDDHAGEWGGAPCCQRCYRAWQNGTIKPWMTFNQARRAVEAIC